MFRSVINEGYDLFSHNDALHSCWSCFYAVIQVWRNQVGKTNLWMRFLWRGFLFCFFHEYKNAATVHFYFSLQLQLNMKLHFIITILLEVWLAAQVSSSLIRSLGYELLIYLLVQQLGLIIRQVWPESEKKSLVSHHCMWPACQTANTPELFLLNVCLDLNTVYNYTVPKYSEDIPLYKVL